MSIATNSLLRRILVEVHDAPDPRGLELTEYVETPEQGLALLRTRDVHAPPFATSMHFWGHALRALLKARGRPELFEALAAHCLCAAEGEAATVVAFESLAQRMDPPVVIARNQGYSVGYRMIDQPVLVSWVAERPEEFVAIFWTCPGWLSAARPLDLD